MLDAASVPSPQSRMVDLRTSRIEAISEGLSGEEVDTILGGLRRERIEAWLLERSTLPEETSRQALAIFWRIVAAYCYLMFVLNDLKDEPRPRGREETAILLRELEQHLSAAAAIAARFRLAAIAGQHGSKLDGDSARFIADRIEEAIASAGLARGLRLDIKASSAPSAYYRPGDTRRTGDGRPVRLVKAAAIVGKLADGVKNPRIFPVMRSAGNQTSVATQALVRRVAILFEALTGERPVVYPDTEARAQASPVLQLIRLLWSELPATLYAEVLPGVPGATLVRTALKSAGLLDP